MKQSLHIVMLGFSVTSSRENHHATTYRALMAELVRRGHDVLFLERDMPWTEGHRDLAEPSFGRMRFYQSIQDLRERFGWELRHADLVILGSFVPDGAEIGAWVTTYARGLTAFYDLDTPVTLAGLERDDCAYITRELVSRFSLYLSVSGGRSLEKILSLGAVIARPLYFSVDPTLHRPSDVASLWELGYVENHGVDERATLGELLVEPARRHGEKRFVVAGSGLFSVPWPPNVDRLLHVPPVEQRAFYGAQRFTLSLTRAGFAPGARLFEAAACGVPVISDSGKGMDDFFQPGREILIAGRASEVLGILEGMTEKERRAAAERARARVLASHTAAHRAVELEAYVEEAWRTRFFPMISSERL